MWQVTHFVVATGQAAPGWVGSAGVGGGVAAAALGDGYRAGRGGAAGGVTVEACGVVGGGLAGDGGVGGHDRRSR